MPITRNTQQGAQRATGTARGPASQPHDGPAHEKDSRAEVPHDTSPDDVSHEDAPRDSVSHESDVHAECAAIETDIADATTAIRTLMRESRRLEESSAGRRRRQEIDDEIKA